MINTITSTAFSGPITKTTTKVQVEGIQSVMPLKPTEPRQTQKVVVKHPQTMEIFQKCHHILLYYKKSSDEDSGWIVAGRLKESVGRALLDYPMIAGRLRWGSDQKGNMNNDDVKELELVSNDSGIRLVEAKLGLSLDEFLVMKDRELAEKELVFWEELNVDDPQFCPLAYFQVTNFECGGYSVGFSLSIVLGDTLELTSFIKHSAKLHKDMFQENKAPVFYLPKLKTHKSFPIPTSITYPKHAGHIIHYNARNADSEDSMTILKQLASECINDAEQKLGFKMDLDFALFFKDRKTDDLTVEVVSKKGLVSPVANLASHEVTSTEWSESHLDDIALWENHKPTNAVYWIRLRKDEGLVMVSSSSPVGTVDVIISIPL